jgi:hypothetical protein
MSSCSFYFRALSANDLLVLYTVVLPLWLENQFGIDSSGKENWYCQAEKFVQASLYTLSPFCLFGLLLNVNFATSFYAYTLGTSFYRHELYSLI